MSAIEQRAKPTEPGMGWEYLAVGKLIRVRDQFFTRDGEWIYTSRFGLVVQHHMYRLYRRRVAL